MKQRATARSVSRRSRGTSVRKTTIGASTRTKRRTGATKSTRRGNASGRAAQRAVSTSDHDEIRGWAEARGGRPAIVGRTRRGGSQGGVLRIDFPGFTGQESLQPISWGEWFEIFDESRLAFLYQDKPGSRFNKLVSRRNKPSRKHR